ncbi:hypothetical protein BDZ89DRAFT_1150061 [Hymenopellis radicata]|nr:hypothetical protein BDZ89DRAFT_1150061 [Hymenopellis radicata]
MTEAPSISEKSRYYCRDRLLTAITITATLGFLLFGYDHVMSGIISAEQFYRAFPSI